MDDIHVAICPVLILVHKSIPEICRILGVLFHLKANSLNISFPVILATTVPVTLAHLLRALLSFLGGRGIFTHYKISRTCN